MSINRNQNVLLIFGLIAAVVVYFMFMRKQDLAPTVTVTPSATTPVAITLQPMEPPVVPVMPTVAPPAPAPVPVVTSTAAPIQTPTVLSTSIPSTPLGSGDFLTWSMKVFNNCYFGNAGVPVSLLFNTSDGKNGTMSMTMGAGTPSKDTQTLPIIIVPTAIGADITAPGLSKPLLSIKKTSDTTKLEGIGLDGVTPFVASISDICSKK